MIKRLAFFLSLTFLAGCSLWDRASCRVETEKKTVERKVYFCEESNIEELAQ